MFLSHCLTVIGKEKIQKLYSHFVKPDVDVEKIETEIEKNEEWIVVSHKDNNVDFLLTCIKYTLYAGAIIFRKEALIITLLKYFMSENVTKYARRYIEYYIQYYLSSNHGIKCSEKSLATVWDILKLSIFKK
jgi:hypothetical protein